VLAFCWTGLLDCGGGFWRVVVSARRVYASENGARYFRGDKGFVNGSCVCGRFRGSQTDVEVLWDLCGYPFIKGIPGSIRF